MEFYSLHAWGMQWEWHSPAGPDYYVPSGHTHYGGYSTTGSVSVGTTIGFLGGGAQYFLYDNETAGDP